MKKSKEEKGRIMEKQEFGELVMVEKTSLYRVAKAILKNDDDCADAIGEAICTGFEKLHTLKRDEYAKTWLIRILINECYSLRRYSQRYFPGEDLIGNVSDRQTEYQEVYEAINRLSSKNRLVIVLYYLEGYSVREIAQMLHMTESGIKNRMWRARRDMKVFLEEEFYG